VAGMGNIVQLMMAQLLDQTRKERTLRKVCFSICFM